MMTTILTTMMTTIMKTMMTTMRMKMVQRCKSYVLLKETKFKIMIMINCFTHREILEEQITPVVLDIEEKAKDENEKHCADRVKHFYLP